MDLAIHKYKLTYGLRESVTRIDETHFSLYVMKTNAKPLFILGCPGKNHLFSLVKVYITNKNRQNKLLLALHIWGSSSNPSGQSGWRSHIFPRAMQDFWGDRHRNGVSGGHGFAGKARKNGLTFRRFISIPHFSFIYFWIKCWDYN